MPLNEHGLGRRVPTDFVHVSKYPLRAVAKFRRTVAVINKSLPVHQSWRTYYDQGTQGACVGFSLSLMMSILNRTRYNAPWLWNEAKKIDEWGDTNPGDNEGTSVRAGCDVLRNQGHCRVRAGKTYVCDLQAGIDTNRWATIVDEIRTAIAFAVPVVFGINWYSAFDSPKLGKGGRYWIGEGDNWGSILGGHAICGYAAYDRYQAFALCNSWGRDYPLVLIPYKAIERLLGEQGEACLITDRP